MAHEQGLNAFFTLQMFAFSASIILLLTAVLSPKVKRQPAWLSLMFSNILATASYSLLLFFGYRSDPRPPFGLCVTQAALGYATPILMAGTTLTLVVTAFISIKNQVSGTVLLQRTRATVLIIGFPYVLHGIMFIASITVGLLNPGTVRRGNRWYCTFILRPPAKVASAIVIGLASVALFFQAAMFWHLRGRWRTMKGNTLRVPIFFLACLLVVVVASVLPDSSDRNVDIALACLPVAAVLILGIAKDIGQAWIFWKKGTPAATLSNSPSEELDAKAEASRTEDCKV